MLHKRRTGELVGAGERIPHPYREGESLIISKWEQVPIKRKRKRDPIQHDIVVYGYTGIDGLNFIGYDSFAPHELGLYWSDKDDAPPRKNRYAAWWKHQRPGLSGV